jgi:transitional endoplasmic reticulum ATPase
MVDVASTLRDAGPEPTHLLHEARWPAPIRTVSLSIKSDAVDDGPVHLLKAVIRTAGGRAARVPSERSGPGMVASSVAVVAGGLRFGGPIGAVAAGLMVYGAHQLHAALRPAPRDIPGSGTGQLIDIEDSQVRLRVGVTYEQTPPAAGVDAEQSGQRAIVLRAAVPSAVVQAAHLRAFVGMVLQVARHEAGRIADPDFLAGRTVRLGAYPDEFIAADPRAVTLDHVGGLTEVVDQLREIALSFKHPSVMERWGARRPQGILMHGPPGTGKTMLARALATEIGGTLREIRTPEILNKYIGESERNIKQIFQDARLAVEPLVLFFDEFDSIIGYAGAGFDAAGHVFNSIAGIFKQEMNTLVEENPNVIVVATTNFPGRVDLSLTRSGRFDVKVEVPVPDRPARADILAKMIRGLIRRHEASGFRIFADDVDIAELAELTDGMTGADFKEALRRVQLAKAISEIRGDAGTPISQNDLKRAIADLRHAGARLSRS